jgi:hypothetical protein
MSQKKEMPVRALPAKRSLFPTLSSTKDVVEMGVSKLPITDHNTLITLLYTYHNTLIDEFLKLKE